MHKSFRVYKLNNGKTKEYLTEFDYNYILRIIRNVRLKAEKECCGHFELDDGVFNGNKYLVNSDRYFSDASDSIYDMEQRLLDIKEYLPLLKISSLLMSIGMPTGLKGYNYTRAAVFEMLSADEPLPCEDLYRIVAENFFTKPENVERCIRNALAQAWDKCKNDENRNRIMAHKPSNFEFISLAAEYVKCN